MQNRYVGDIGDYLKLGILRALSHGHRLGVAWWLCPDESRNRDGRHTSYLQRPDRWRRFDPELFATLAEIVGSGRRNVSALEAASLLLGGIFASESMPMSRPASLRAQARREWFKRTAEILAYADFVFVDPDNGLQPSGFSYASAEAGKSVLLGELLELARRGDA